MACLVFQFFIDKTEDITLHLCHKIHHKIWSEHLIPKTTWDMKPCTESELINGVTDLRGTVTLLTLRGLNWGPAGSKRSKQEAWSKKLVKLRVSHHKNQELAVAFIRKKLTRKPKSLGFQICFSGVRGLCIQLTAVSTIFCPCAPACAQKQVSRHLTRHTAEAAREAASETSLYCSYH